MREEILGLFGRFRRRHLWVRGWDLFLEAAFIMTIAAGAMLLLDRLAFEVSGISPTLSSPERVAIILGTTLALAAAVAAAVILLRPTPPAVIAWALDRASGGEERFLSALEVAARGEEGMFTAALCRDAAEVARRTRPSSVLPRVPVGYRWGILLSLATGTLLYAYPPRVHGAPAADFEISPRRGPAALEVSFQDASIGAIDEFLWDFGDGRKARGERATHVYEVPGVYTASLTLRGPGGESRKTASIEVLPSDRPAADFSAEPRKGYIPLRVRFANLSRNSLRFRWDFGDGTTSTETEPVHTYARPGHYAVRLVAENEVGSDEQLKPRYVKASHPDEPLADFRAVPREGEAPLEVSFENLSTGAQTEWEWNFGDPRDIGGGTRKDRNPVHTYTAPGKYTVRLRVKGLHGEDEEEKVHYIHVKDEGGGKGQGSGGKKDPNPPPSKKPQGGSSGPEGKLFGEKTSRPPVQIIPETVKHAKPGTEEGIREVRIATPSKEGTGRAEEVPLQTILPQYRRAAEDSIERERIPPALREYFRRYYESLGPTK